MSNPTALYEDKSILIVNKPAGITVNNADTNRNEMTLQDWIIAHYGQYYTSPSEEGAEFFSRAGIVHRLDKETSGVILIAKTPEAFERLQREFKERIVKKTYIALVHGELTPPEGEIRVPIGRLSFNRKRFGVVAQGRESITAYKTLGIKRWKKGKSQENLSLVELYPQTGRTHQIRVHLKYLNHPIVSDELYAGRKTARDDRKYLPRLFLHASKITFMHPSSEKQMTFAAEMPSELQVFLQTLR